MAKNKVRIIAAVSKNGVIGNSDKLPWSIPSDLAHFKTLTAGGVVVMGHGTWRSMGCKGLAGRRNVVLSASGQVASTGKITPEVYPSFDQAMWALSSDTSIKTYIDIIGGASLYKQALPIVDMMVISHINAVVEGNVFFPFFDTDCYFTTTNEEFKGPRDDHPYKVICYHKRTMGFS